jgi:hypothetical protein
MHCPTCVNASGNNFIDNHHGSLFGNLSTYKPAIKRLLSWGEAYYHPNLLTQMVPCISCGRPTRLRMYPSADAPKWVQTRYGDRQAVYHECVCGGQSCSSLDFLVLALPQGRRFWREHSRIRSLPSYEIETRGRRAIVTRFESVGEYAHFEVISALDTYETLGIS